MLHYIEDTCSHILASFVDYSNWPYFGSFIEYSNWPQLPGHLRKKNNRVLHWQHLMMIFSFIEVSVISVYLETKFSIR